MIRMKCLVTFKLKASLNTKSKSDPKGIDIPFKRTCQGCGTNGLNETIFKEFIVDDEIRSDACYVFQKYDFLCGCPRFDAEYMSKGSILAQSKLHLISQLLSVVQMTLSCTFLKR